jgi:ParB-like chromosome segregation protein Spo0J
MRHLGFTETAARMLGQDAAIAAIIHHADKLARAERLARNAQRALRS